jgi:hypothetical protein
MAHSSSACIQSCSDIDAGLASCRLGPCEQQCDIDRGKGCISSIGVVSLEISVARELTKYEIESNFAIGLRGKAVLYAPPLSITARRLN